MALGLCVLVSWECKGLFPYVDRHMLPTLWLECVWEDVYVLVSGRSVTPPVVVRMLAGVLGVLLAPEARVLQRMGSGWGQGHPARGLLMAAAGGSSERGLQVKLA